MLKVWGGGHKCAWFLRHWIRGRGKWVQDGGQFVNIVDNHSSTFHITKRVTNLSLTTSVVMPTGYTRQTSRKSKSDDMICKLWLIPSALFVHPRPCQGGKIASFATPLISPVHVPMSIFVYFSVFLVLHFPLIEDETNLWHLAFPEKCGGRSVAGGD